jgi:hypothetical protein
MRTIRSPATGVATRYEEANFIVAYPMLKTVYLFKGKKPNPNSEEEDSFIGVDLIAQVIIPEEGLIIEVDRSVVAVATPEFPDFKQQRF